LKNQGNDGETSETSQKQATFCADAAIQQLDLLPNKPDIHWLNRGSPRVVRPALLSADSYGVSDPTVSQIEQCRWYNCQDESSY
jgi:hypothetical protein